MQRDVLDDCQTPALVDSLVAAYLDALDRGQAPARTDWLARHPEHADELSRFLDDMETLSPRHNPTLMMSAAVFAPASSSTNRPGGIANAQALESLDATLADPAMPASTLSAGMLLNGEFGEYELLKVVARGGMGIVFKSRHKKLERVVALKMILAGQLASEQDVKRFHTEAQAAAPRSSQHRSGLRSWRTQRAALFHHGVR